MICLEYHTILVMQIVATMFQFVKTKIKMVGISLMMKL